MSVSLNENLPEGLNHRQRGGGVPSCFLIGYFLSYLLSSVITYKKAKEEASWLHNRPWLTESKAFAKSIKQVYSVVFLFYDVILFIMNSGSVILPSEFKLSVINFVIDICPVLNSFP